MKFTVNPTPHGLMLFIPDWMSLDIWRDLVHHIITDLQRRDQTPGPQVQ